MMRRGLWVRGTTAPVLAKRWGVSVTRVEDISAEASRMIAREIQDPERVKVDVSTVLLQNLHRASEAREFTAVAKLGDVVTRVLGARAPERTQEVPLSEEQARARYRELTGREWGE